jgi:hypothetical protein
LWLAASVHGQFSVAFQPVVRQSRGARSRAQLLSMSQQERNFFVTTPSIQVSHESINGLIHLLGQSLCDLITCQRPHLSTLLHSGPSLLHMSFQRTFNIQTIIVHWALKHHLPCFSTQPLPPLFCTLLIFFVFFSVAGFELRASALLGSHSTT